MASALEEIRFSSQGRELYGRLHSHADDAPTVLLLCGLGFHTFEYEPLAVLLADKGTNRLRFDYRGHGRSSGARGVWTLEDLVTDTRCGIVLVRERFRGPVYLFGNSLGGMVGILAGAMDSNVAGIVACNCPAHLADFMLTRFRRLLFSTMKIVGALVSFRISVNHFYSYGQLIRDESWVNTFESDPLIADARRLSMPTYQSLLEGWDGTTAVARVRKPLLILQGRRDEMQPPDQSEILFAAANEPKDYHLLETGHLPHLEDTKALCELLIDWMGPVGRAT